MIDWEKPIQWSTGEYAFVSGEPQTRSVKHVSACSRWTKHTDAPFVHVDAKTGVILGFSEEDYPYIQNPPASDRTTR
jgi:hypothetical protein